MSRDLISTAGVNGSGNIEFSGLSLSAHQALILEIDGVRPDANGRFGYLRLSTGATFHTTGYRHALVGNASSAGTLDNDSNSGTFLPIMGAGADTNWGTSNDAGKSGRATIMISNALEALNKLVSWQAIVHGPSGSLLDLRGAGSLAQTGNLDGIRFYPHTGSGWAAGEAALYSLSQ